MKSPYSNTTTNKKTKALYDQHLTQEVVNNITDAKQIANDYAANKRYVHRAKVTTVGNANVRPYYPVYLDGLPNGLSGYWTVLSVRHTFGGIPARYMLALEVGTDIIGETNPNASKAVAIRDVQAEIIGQDEGGVVEPILFSIELSPNSSSIAPDYGNTIGTSITQPSEVAIPEGLSTNMYAVNPPDFSQISRKVTWVSSSKTGVTNV
jgi:hypothetical protein